MNATIYALHESVTNKGKYVMTLDINNATFESIGIRTIKEWARVTGKTEKELKNFIKK